MDDEQKKDETSSKFGRTYFAVQAEKKGRLEAFSTGNRAGKPKKIMTQKIELSPEQRAEQDRRRASAATANAQGEGTKPVRGNRNNGGQGARRNQGDNANGERRTAQSDGSAEQPRRNPRGRRGQAPETAQAAELPVNVPTRRKGKKGAVLKVMFLGGVGEIGKNMTALEFGNDIVVIDAGLTFPDDEMPGIDLVIPDITYLINNRQKVRGVVITHGHEDHVGGLPYLLKELSVPVYGTKLTLAIADNKLREHRINDAKMNCVKPRDKVKLGCFCVEFINVNHSIAGSCALSIDTPIGKVFHTGDFKIDTTPVTGEPIDIPRIAEVGQEGVLLLLGESTNVERPGYTLSERVVGTTLDHIFAENVGSRLIVATFASNVHRLQQIIELAIKHKRKVALSGRSMINVSEAASKIGELKIPDGVLIDIEKTKNCFDRELVIVCTGSQGEPMSALTRMAAGDYKQVSVGANDTIVISASPIPGNEKMVYRVINNLYRKGAKVIYESLEKIHVSGHACQEELKMIHTLVKPKFFIPVHGEYRHLKRHADLALTLGMRQTNILLADIGNCVELTRDTIEFGDNFPSGSRLVDGIGIEDGGEQSVVLRDRKHLAEDGIYMIVVGISAESGEILSGPDVVYKGVVADGDMTADIKRIVAKAVDGVDIRSDGDRSELRGEIRRALKNFLFKKTKKNPIIVPVIMEI